MIRLPKGTWLYQNDRLVSRWRLPDGTVVFQGKRVSANCPLTTAERKAYVRKGVVEAVKMVKQRLECDLRTAIDTVSTARNGDWP